MTTDEKHAPILKLWGGPRDGERGTLPGYLIRPDGMPVREYGGGYALLAVQTHADDGSIHCAVYDWRADR